MIVLLDRIVAGIKRDDYRLIIPPPVVGEAG